MYKINIILILCFILLLLVVPLTFNVSLAQIGDNNTEVPPIPPVTLENPLGSGVESPQVLIGKVIKAILGIVGSLALVMFIYGGLVWMTAAGNTESIKKGKDILIWAAVGLVIIFSAYALVTFVFSNVLGLTA